jgi:ribosomal protein S18 acetylase RimI-like enzyme
MRQGARLFSVRPADEADAPALAELFLETRRASMPYLPELHSTAETRAWMRDVVVRCQEVWVAVSPRGIAGFAALDGALLAHLYVEQAEQGRGAGSALLRRAKEARPDGFRLYVFQRNTRARGFYEARGLRLVELGDGSANEEGEPDALYAWRPSDALR